MRHEDVTIMDVIKGLPFIFVIGMISAFWAGGFAYLILKIGTQQYNWRSFDLFEIIIASSVVEILTSKIFQHDCKYPFRDMFVYFISPPIVYLIVLTISKFN